MLCPEIAGWWPDHLDLGEGDGQPWGTRGSCVCAGCTEGACSRAQLYPEHLAPRTLWRLQWGVPVIADHQPVYSFLGSVWVPLGRWKDGSRVFTGGGNLSMQQQVAGILVMFVAHWDIWLAVPPPAL